MAVIEWLGSKIQEVQTLVQAALGVAAILSIGWVWWKTKALVPTLGALILAGVVLWGTANLDWFKTKIGEESRLLLPLWLARWGPGLAATDD